MLLKIDVEGYEAEFFKGATRALYDPRLRAIITEAQDPEILGMLKSAGFTRRYYNPEHTVLRNDQGPTSSNALIVRSDM
jgi:hypothetical protein